MFTDNDRLILTTPVSGLPLLTAASAAYSGKACGSCNHRNVNVHSMLNLAAIKYRNDKRFILHCKNLLGLPCVVGGVLIEENNNG